MKTIAHSAAQPELIRKEVLKAMKGRKMSSRKRLLCLVFLPFLLASCAGSSKFMRPAQSLLNPTEDKALVRFLRPSKFQGGGRDFAILDGEKTIGNIPNNTQFNYLAAPGKHLFISTAAGIGPYFLEAELEAGKTYYIIVEAKVGFTISRAFLIPVDRSSKFWDKVVDYEKRLKRLEPDTKLLRIWEEKNKPEIIKVIAAYESVWKQEREWPRLNPEDGR